jgi:hypothetical protein
MIDSYSLYYQATVYRSQTWQLVAILKSFEYLAFDRALEKSLSDQLSLFEFFVPHLLNNEFIDLMNYFKINGIVQDYIMLNNRFLQSI